MMLSRSSILREEHRADGRYVVNWLANKSDSQQKKWPRRVEAVVMVGKVAQAVERSRRSTAWITTAVSAVEWNFIITHAQDLQNPASQDMLPTAKYTSNNNNSPISPARTHIWLLSRLLFIVVSPTALTCATSYDNRHSVSRRRNYLWMCMHVTEWQRVTVVFIPRGCRRDKEDATTKGFKCRKSVKIGSLWREHATRNGHTACQRHIIIYSRVVQ